MEYKGLNLNEAVSMVVQKKLVAVGGSGGVIAVDRNGEVSLSFNTSGMFRAYANESSENIVAIFK